MARRARYEQLDHSSLDLVSVTQLADRTISNDLEFLAEKAVDTKKANYAVITGTCVPACVYAQFLILNFSRCSLPRLSPEMVARILQCDVRMMLPGKVFILRSPCMDSMTCVRIMLHEMVALLESVYARMHTQVSRSTTGHLS